MKLKELSSKKFQFFSPFSMAVLRKDLTRFMGIWIAYCVITLLEMPSAWVESEYLLWQLTSELSGGGPINGTFALVAGLCLFGDLHNSRLCNGLHALPVRRETWLATHLLAAGIFWVVPFTARALLYMLALGENWFIAALWLLGMAGQYLFYLSLAALCAVCAGTKVGMATMYGLINFGSMLCYGFVSTVYEPLLPGIQIPDTPFALFSPISYLMDSQLIRISDGSSYFDYETTYVYEGLGSGWWYIGVISVVAVGLIALAVVAYRRRRLEAAGEMVVFRPLTSLVWLFLTLTFGILVQAMGLLMDQSTASLIVGLVLGGMLAQLLMHRNTKSIPLGLAKGAGVAAVIGLTMLIATIDPLGITRWQPKAEDVKSVTISDYFYYQPDPDSYGDYLVITDRESIEDIIHTHGLLIEDGMTSEPLWSTGEYGSIHITYKLKNGTEKVRRYYYELESEVSRTIAPLWSDPRFLLGYQDWNTFLQQQTGADIWSYEQVCYLNSEQTRELLTAIKTDCENGTWSRDGYYSVEVSLHSGVFLSVCDTCPTTTAWLREHYPHLYEES